MKNVYHGELVRNMVIYIHFNSINRNSFCIKNVMFTTVHLSTGWLMPVKVVILPEYA